MSTTSEIIQDAIDEQLSIIKFNLSNVLGGLLYSVKLELEDMGVVGSIDDLIRLIVDTSEDSDHGDESYPVWVLDKRYPDGKDKANKNRAMEIISALTLILQKHGIKQSYNITNEDYC
jgi:hypothetical protein